VRQLLSQTKRTPKRTPKSSKKQFRSNDRLGLVHSAELSFWRCNQGDGCRFRPAPPIKRPFGREVSPRTEHSQSKAASNPGRGSPSTRSISGYLGNKVEIGFRVYAGARIAARTYSASNTPLYSATTPRDERGRLDSKTTALSTLDYSYFANGLLEDVVSSNANGVNIGYRYDEANRLAYVNDASTGTVHTASYTYNANGSLATVGTPNGVSHTYSYDSLNRLRTLTVAKSAVTLRSYTYSLNPSGHRHIITESTGRTATYAHDGVYRLTSETVAGVADPGQVGIVGYTLDKVGNRLSRSSSVSSVSSGEFIQSEGPVKFGYLRYQRQHHCFPRHHRSARRLRFRGPLDHPSQTRRQHD
jgi:YD repeat-containing protein